MGIKEKKRQCTIPHFVNKKVILLKMKLLTHNMLTSSIIKGVKKGFPLKIEASEVREHQIDFNPDVVAKIIPKVEWPALHEAAESLGKSADLPSEVAPEFESNEDFLKKAHHVLLEVEVLEGSLICPETGRKFPISNGIPNMLLKEDEV